MTRRRLGLAAAIVLIATVSVALLDRLNSAVPLNSDQASIVLLGHDLLAGNVLLAGWILPPDTFYTSRVPLVALLQLVLGFGPWPVGLSAAIAGTAVALCGGWLGLRGRRPHYVWVGGLLSFALLLAPVYLPDQPQLLLGGTNHAGTIALLMLGLVILDAGGDSWIAQIGCAAMFGLAAAGDPMAFWIGGGAVVAVAAIRLLTRAGPRGVEVRLALLTLGAIAAGRFSLTVIYRLGGLYHQSSPTDLVPVWQLPGRVLPLIQNLLTLYGADVRSAVGPLGWTAWVHVTGMLMALAAVVLAAVRWPRLKQDRISQVLLIGMALDIAAVMLNTIGLNFSRYLLVFMAFGAALAGRVAAPWFTSRRLPWLPAAVAALYLAATLGAAVTVQPAAPPTAQVQSWLAAHGYTTGLGEYWSASVITVATSGRITVRPIVAQGGSVTRYVLNSEKSWYDSTKAEAHFVVFATSQASYVYSVDPQSLQQRFGPPSETETFGDLVVMTWPHQNLFKELDGA